jgi:hypothetical protein
MSDSSAKLLQVEEIQMSISARAALLAAGLAVSCYGAAAQGLAEPAGQPILTISGAIGITNGEGVAVFDRAMLETMPVVTTKTSTIWTEGVHEFTGVALADVLAAVDAMGATLRATAINDYAVDIPVSDAIPEGPIIAYAMDGSAMSVRDKGPLWIIYPYDASEDYRTEVVYSRSIWQLNRIEVLP